MTSPARSEDALITRLQEIFGPGERVQVGSGDDCAQIAAPEGHVIVTTDILVEDRHYRREWSTPGQIGYRACMQNLADIAGQGGVPTALVIAVTLSNEADQAWLIGVSEGFAQALEGTPATVVGGDISGGPLTSIAVTALGYCPAGSVLRCGAEVGDTVAVCGTLGHSAAGYKLIDSGVVEVNPAGPESLGQWEREVSVFRTPRPPIEAGPAAAKAGAHAMMDVSDGLSTDLTRLARASRVRIDLDEELLAPFARRLADAGRATGTDPWEWILNGGEDHALVATFPPHLDPLPAGFVPVGRVSADAEGGQLYFAGSPLAAGGWDHLRG